MGHYLQTTQDGDLKMGSYRQWGFEDGILHAMGICRWDLTNVHQGLEDGILQ